MGKFIVRNGELEGRKFRLEAGAKISLGRELGDLNFPDKRMSRKHCVLEAREDGDYVHDLESTNGTWVNNQRVSEVKLTPGDLVRVGFTELEFLGVPPPPTADGLAGLLRRSGSAVNQTIAFRPSPEGGGALPIGDAAVGATDARRDRGKSRMRAAKVAAMGKGAASNLRLISAKGKFCEACGEAIFMKEGAPDEGKMIEGLYLCRMCAQIAEREHGVEGEHMPSYAKIVGGRMPEPSQAAHDAQDGPGMEIVESEEVDMDGASEAPPEVRPARGTTSRVAPAEVAEAHSPAGLASMDQTVDEGTGGAAASDEVDAGAYATPAEGEPPVGAHGGAPGAGPVRADDARADDGEPPPVPFVPDRDEDCIMTPPRGSPPVEGPPGARGREPGMRNDVQKDARSDNQGETPRDGVQP